MSGNKFDLEIKYNINIIAKRKTGRYSLQEILNIIDINNYNILKITRKQRFITYNELLKEEYAGYVLYEKDININNITIWIDFLNNIGGIEFIVKIPPFNPHNKIIVR